MTNAGHNINDSLSNNCIAVCIRFEFGILVLKALFNNIFTLKSLSACPNIIPVSLIRFKNEALKKNLPKKHH